MADRGRTFRAIYRFGTDATLVRHARQGRRPRTETRITIAALMSLGEIPGEQHRRFEAYCPDYERVTGETAYEALREVPGGCDGLRAMWPVGQGPDAGDGVERITDLGRSAELAFRSALEEPAEWWKAGSFPVTAP